MQPNPHITSDPGVSFLDDGGSDQPSWWHRFQRKCTSRVYRGKFYYMFGMYVSSFFAGLVAGLKGPAFMDLQQITGVGTSKGSAFFTAAAVGSVVGNLVGGALYDRYNRHIVLFCSSFLYGVTCAIIPWCSMYWTMVFIFLMHEFVTGAARSGTNVEIVEEWGDQGKPFMQALHFSFSIGATVSPFILEPFLSSGTFSDDNLSDNTTLKFEVNPNLTRGNFSATATSSTQITESRIHYAFLIVGTLACLSSFIFLIKYYQKKQEGRRRVQRQNANEAKKTGDEIEEPNREKRRLSLRLCILTILLFGLFYFFLDEVEDTTPSFLSTFVVMQLGWTKVYGGRLTSAFWASYTAGKGFGIVLVSLVTHIQLFTICSIVLCLGEVGLLLSGRYQFGTGIWISIVTIGLSLSVIFPASLTWTEEKLLPLSGKLMGIIYGALAVGGLVNPQIIGLTMANFSPMCYSYVLCAESVLFVITFLALVIFVRKVLSRHNQM